MVKTEELSKQQLKSKETKDRIFQAAKTILRKKGYEGLSIKNICEEAGVSNGSIDPDCLELPANAEEAKTAIIHVYLNYAHYCRELGLDFVSNYYTPKNQSLNPDIRTERPYPIVTVQHYLQRAIDAGILHLKHPLEEVTTDIRIIVIGNVFEWCLKNGDADFEGNIRRLLTTYLDGLM